MYDELVKRLREADISHPPVYLLSRAADAIEQLSNAGSAYGRGWTLGYDAGREESKPRWIPVTERLPEKEKKSYLCRTDVGYHCEVRWTDNKYGLWSGGGEWGWSIFDIPQYSKVTHWMPLPESPKEE